MERIITMLLVVFVIFSFLGFCHAATDCKCSEIYQAIHILIFCASAKTNGMIGVTEGH